MKRLDIDTMKLERLVSTNLRLLRLSRNTNKTELAAKLKISGFQLGKYENSVNRISAGRLAMVSKVLNVPIESFFKSCNVPLSKSNPRNEGQLLKMAELFVEVLDQTQQDALLNLIESLIPKENKTAK